MRSGAARRGAAEYFWRVVPAGADLRDFFVFAAGFYPLGHWPSVRAGPFRFKEHFAEDRGEAGEQSTSW